MLSEPVDVLEVEGLDLPRRRVVLIVHPDESQVYVFSRRFEHQGFDTIAAYRGDRGLVLARQRRPDVILLNVRLPDVDGFAACRQLTDDPTTCWIPVILLNEGERQDWVPLARSAGCTFYLQEPHDPNVLLALVEHSAARCAPPA